MKTNEIRCLCGEVVVSLRGDALSQFYCHCDDCQATSGGAYVGIALFPKDAVTITGKTTTWTLKSLPRQRCARCGTQLLGFVPGLEQYGVKANLLPKGMFAPAFHIQCRYAVLPIVDDLPHFKSVPAQFGGTDEQVDW